MPHLSGPRRYFFHHSNRVLSLQNNPSLAGKIVGTRIEKYRPLVMPPRFVRQLRNNTAQSLVLHTQGLPHVKNKRTCARVRKMKAQFLACGKRNTKTERQMIATCCNRLQNGLVCDVSSALISAFALRTLTSNKHIPFISTLRISFCSGVGVPPYLSC